MKTAPIQPILLDESRAARLRAELESWIGTPWVHCSAERGRTRAVKGVRGDCVHTIVAAFENAGIIEPVTIPPSASNAGIGTAEGPETMSAILTMFVNQGRMAMLNPWHDDLIFGDLLTFRFAGREHHIGVYRGGRNGMFYHSGGGVGPTSSFRLSSLREQVFKAALRRAFRFIVPKDN